MVAMLLRSSVIRRRHFIIRNSWGVEWGHNGFVHTSCRVRDRMPSTRRTGW